ncbi:uncharacterized protein LOC106053393 [Biomphalaria glabrata]|uniref:Uncharacterized protein LOC106053393 n=1 Tax=Biomphalaria glabrata TaxID=6526 RepID=A0A9W2ZC67_BIOGL|nr:uncharacterized protein LOC106053393 [Biomphalaria glabrata]
MFLAFAYLLVYDCPVIRSVNFSSVGTHYIIPWLPERINEGARGFLYLYTFSTVPVEVCLKIRIWNSVDAITNTIVIPAKSMVNVTIESYVGLLKTKPVEKVEFLILEGTGDYGLTVYIQKNNHNMASFTAISEKYFGTDYFFIAIKDAYNETTICVMDEWFKINIFCRGVSSTYYKFSDYRYKISPTTSCSERQKSLYIGTAASDWELKRPFGYLFTSYTDMKLASLSCLRPGNAVFSLEMPLITAVLGMEYVTVSSGHVPSSVLIVSTRPLTTVKWYTTKQGDFKNFFFEKDMDILWINHKPGAYRIVSNFPIQVILVFNESCLQKSESETLSDLSMAIISPFNLFYNVYFVGIPLLPNLSHFVLLVVTMEGLTSFRLNSYDYSGEKWTDAIGFTSWKFLETPLTQWYNHLISNEKFGCYVYGAGENAGYAHSAGFSYHPPVPFWTMHSTTTTTPTTPTTATTTRKPMTKNSTAANSTAEQPECAFSKEIIQGDGVDNDCDGKVDEEDLDEKDDDEDGQIDEDTHRTDVPFLQTNAILIMIVLSLLVLFFLALMYMSGKSHPPVTTDHSTASQDQSQSNEDRTTTSNEGTVSELSIPTASNSQILMSAQGAQTE